MAELKGTKTHENLKDAFAGESQANRRYLYFAKVADVEGYPEIAGNFRETAEGETGHAHGHLDYLQAGRRPGHRPADRRHRDEPQGRRRGRDPRVHRHVPGHGQDRARGGLRRDRRLVRDAGQGREVARRPLPEDARHASASTAVDAAGGRGAARPPAARRPPSSPRGPGDATMSDDRQADLLPADRRALLRPRGAAVLGRGRAARARSRALRDLPRLSHVLQVLRLLPDRSSSSSTRSTTATSRRLTRRRDRAGHGRLLPVQAVRGAVPVHAARQARVPARLPEARAPLQGAAREEQRGVELRDRVLGDPDAAGALARASASGSRT